MADTMFKGPVISMGSLEAEQANATIASIGPMDGPMGAYQGYTLLDPRYYPIPAEGLLPGRVSGFMVFPDWCTIDAVPQAQSTTVVSTSIVMATTGANIALINAPTNCGGTTAANIALGVQIIPQGTTVATTVMALDFGFTVGTTTGAATTVQVPDNTLFTLGQWICIGNVANAAGTASLFCQVMSIGTTATGIATTVANATQFNYTTITVSPAPQTTLFSPIGQAGLFGANLVPAAAQFGPSSPTPQTVTKQLQAGVQKIHNPREQLARTLCIAAVSTTGGTGAVKVFGFDVWGQPMAELLTAAGTVAQYGNKAWKYVSLITNITTAAASVSVGIGDQFGFPIRADEWQQLTIWAGNTAIQNNVGFVAAATAFATNTSLDVRGTITLSNNATATPISNVATSNGTTRLVVFQVPALDRMIAATPNNAVSLFGVAQATT